VLSDGDCVDELGLPGHAVVRVKLCVCVCEVILW
jgi:hypothetical protein